MGLDFGTGQPCGIDKVKMKKTTQVFWSWIVVVLGSILIGMYAGFDGKRFAFTLIMWWSLVETVKKEGWMDD